MIVPNDAQAESVTKAIEDALGAMTTKQDPVIVAAYAAIDAMQPSIVAAEQRGAAKERERCAKIAETFSHPARMAEIHGDTALDADIIAASIRTEGTKP